MQYLVIGGGGSGANGDAAGNDGGDSSLKIGDGSKIHLVGKGGKKGNASQGGSGGSGGQKGGVDKIGTEGGGGFDGLSGTKGVNGVTNKGW